MTRFGRQAGRLRALLLVPILVGSSAVGVALLSQGASAAPTPPGKGTLQVCESADHGMAGHSFTITVDGTAIPAVQGGACSAQLTEREGEHKLVEAVGAGLEVLHITAQPARAKVSGNLGNGHSTVKVSAGAKTVVTYSNKAAPAQLKVCKQAASDSTQLIGQPFSFSINGGSAFTIDAGAHGSPNCSGLTTYASGTNITVEELRPTDAVRVSDVDVTTPPASNVHTDLNARTVSLTLGPGVSVVTYTNRVHVSAQPGYLEVCKDAADQFVSGNFAFAITDAAGKAYTQTVLVGQCSGAFKVTAGPATITETSRVPYSLGQVSTDPSGRLISDNLSNGSATVSVVAGDQSNETMVHFINDTESGLVKVCKTLSSNSGALTGTLFTFPYTSTTGPGGSVGVTAAAPGQTACTVIPGPLHGGFPLGTGLSITEDSTASVHLAKVTVAPSSADDGSSNGTARLTVGPGVTSATFDNQAMGTLEICKDAADNQTTGKPFLFAVNGGAPITVHAGECSPTIAVPAGTATIAEGPSTSFHLVSVTALGPGGISRLTSGPNPAQVSVPFGGVSNETQVTFTNAVNTGSFTLCKTTTATADGSGILLGGDTFSFAWNYTVDDVETTGTTSLTLPVNGQPGVTVCNGLIGPIPVQQSNNGAPVTVNVAETPSVGVHVLSINYQGSGRLTASSTMAGTASFSVGQFVNTLTYDNEPNPPPLGAAPTFGHLS